MGQFGRARDPGAARGRRLRVLFAVAACALAALPAGAQRYHIHRYIEADGLPSAHVSGLVQAHDGRIWIASRVGAASYDGQEWTNYDRSDGLPDQDLSHIGVAADGTIWVTTRQVPVRLVRFDGNVWTAVPPPVAREGAGVVTAMTMASDRSRQLVVLGDEHGSIHIWDGASWSAVPPPAGPTPVAVRTLAAVGAELLVGTTRGLTRVDLHAADKAQSPVPALGRLDVRAVEHDPALGTTWVVGNDWVGTLEDEALTRIGDHLALRFYKSLSPTVAESDGHGGLYIGTFIELYYFHPRRGLENLGPHSGLVASGGTALHRDREDNLWVGCLRGISKIVSRRFHGYDSEDGLYADEVSAVLELRSGEILLGHPGGVTVMDSPPRTSRLAAPDLPAHVLDLVEDAEGTVWVAGAQAGLYAARKGRDYLPVRLGTDGNNVAALRIDRQGRLWVASGDGLFLKRGNGFDDTGLRAFVRRIVESRDGGLYLATPEGLYYKAEDRVVYWPPPGAAGAGNVYAIFETDTETLVGTAAGLYRILGDTLAPVEAPWPRVDRPVYFIVADGIGRLWFGTDNGVTRWDGSESTEFTVADGLIGAETNRAAGVLDSGGRLWIGTNRGVSVHHPEYDLPRSSPPQVHLIEADVAGKCFPTTHRSEVEPQSTVVFRFRATAFVDEKRVRYGYRLDGFDPEWNGPEALPTWELRYTNLPPGSYRLRLQAIDAEGRRSAVEQSAPIVVRVPVWQRGPFIALAIVASLLFVLGIFSYVAQHRYSRQLEAEVEARSRQLTKAQKLEALGQLAGGIAHDFNNALTVVLGNLALIDRPGDPALNARVGAVRSATLQAQRLARQLLTFSQGGAPVRRAVSIERVVRESAAFSLSSSAVSCEIDLPDDLWVVEIDEDQMGQVIGNLLINARQASTESGRIVVRGRNLEPDPGEPAERRGIVIEVEDEGTGIAPEHLDRIFDPYFTTKRDGSGLGLATAYSIVTRHEGQLTVESAPDRGSIFRIWLPASTRQDEARFTTVPAPGAVGGRLLVMDDEPAVRAVIAESLERHGYLVEQAGDGSEAIERFRAARTRGRPFDAVIMDLTVPGGMGGKEALAHLREIDPAIKAIVVSGYSDDPVMSRFADHGFAACIGKPFAPVELTRAVEDVLRGSTATDASGPASDATA